MTVDVELVVKDRLDLFLEVEAIEDALAVIEQRHGVPAELEALRRRLHGVRVCVLAQLRALLDVGNTEPTVH